MQAQEEVQRTPLPSAPASDAITKTQIALNNLIGQLRDVLYVIPETAPPCDLDGNFLEEGVDDELIRFTSPPPIPPSIGSKETPPCGVESVADGGSEPSEIRSASNLDTPPTVAPDIPPVLTPASQGTAASLGITGLSTAAEELRSKATTVASSNAGELVNKEILQRSFMMAETVKMIRALVGELPDSRKSDAHYEKQMSELHHRCEEATVEFEDRIAKLNAVSDLLSCLIRGVSERIIEAEAMPRDMT